MRFFRCFLKVIEGPTAAPILTLSNKSEPRKVIGSVDAISLFIILAETLHLFGFWVLGSFDGSGSWLWPVGGGIAAPLVAYICKRVQPKLLGAFVGLILVLTNLWTIASLLFYTSFTVKSLIYPQNSTL